MRPLLSFSRAVDRANRAIGELAAWLSLAMVALGAYNTVARYVGRWAGRNLASNAFVESQWYLFGALFLLAAAATLRSDRHVRVDVLYGKLSARGKAWIDLVGAIVFLLPFCAFALWTSWEPVRNSWLEGEGSPDPGGLPRYPIKTLIPLSFVLLFLQGVSEAIKRAAFLRGIEADGGEAGGTREGRA